MEKTKPPREQTRSDPAERGVQRVLTVAETAECGCPEWCDRDHDK